MKRSTKNLFIKTPPKAGRALRRTLHHLDHPNCHHPKPDAYTEAGDHLERFVPSTQDLDNPPVPKPQFVLLANGKIVRYVGP